MSNVIVFISPAFDSTMFQKIAETLLIRHVKTTENPQHATVVLIPSHDTIDPDALIQQYTQIYQDMIRVSPSIITPENVSKLQKRFFSYNHPNTKKYESTRAMHKQILFNRTNCK